MSGSTKSSNAIFAASSRSGRRTTRSVAIKYSGICSATNGKTRGILLGGFSFTQRSARQHGRNLHEIVGEHGRRDPQLKALATFSETTFHAATAEQHRDAPLDTCAKALAGFELRALLIGFALGRFDATPLRNAHHVDAPFFARRHVFFAEEAAIRSIQFREVAEGLLVALQRRNHMLFVDGISVQNFILRDQAVRAFGEEDLMAELDGRLHLAALDEVRVGFENRIDLLGSWNLLAVEHAAARLI